MRNFLLILYLFISISSFGQILDMDMDCPIIYPQTYISQNEIQSISLAESGDNVKTKHKKRVNALTTYYFDSTGLAYMKIQTDMGGYVDTFMMNGERCRFKTDPDSRFYEPNIFCNDKGLIIANQTERSSYFYRFDGSDRLYESIQIDKEEEGESNVLLIKYSYDSLGHMDTIIEKEGSLRYNLSIRQMDTIYRSTVTRAVHYAGNRMVSIVTFTNNNREQTIAASIYKYTYKADILDRVDLYIGEEKKPLYTLRVVRVEYQPKE